MLPTGLAAAAAPITNDSRSHPTRTSALGPRNPDEGGFRELRIGLVAAGDRSLVLSGRVLRRALALFTFGWFGGTHVFGCHGGSPLSFSRRRGREGTVSQTPHPQLGCQPGPRAAGPGKRLPRMAFTESGSLAGAGIGRGTEAGLPIPTTTELPIWPRCGPRDRCIAGVREGATRRPTVGCAAQSAAGGGWHRLCRFLGILTH
jgi:hypothetical protein